MKDNYVADELLKLKQLLDSGAITQSEYDSQKKKLLNDSPSTINPKQSKPDTIQKKKKPGCLVVVLIFVVVFAVIMAIGVATQPTTSSDIIVDMTQFSGLNYDQLVNIMGGPGQKDEYGIPLTTVSGRSVQGDFFYYPESKLEFLVAENQVIQATYFSESSPIPYSSSPREILSMFGVTPNDSARVTAETPAAYRVSPVNDKVADFWVAIMDASSKTFEMVKVTYNANYM